MQTHTIDATIGDAITINGRLYKISPTPDLMTTHGLTLSRIMDDMSDEEIDLWKAQKVPAPDVFDADSSDVY